MRCSAVRKPWTASRPLVVADRVRMASAILASVSRAGRPSPAPPSITPLALEQVHHLAVGAQRQPFDGQPQWFGEWARCGDVVRERLVVPCHQGQGWPGPPWDRSNVIASPVGDGAHGYSGLTRAVVLQRGGDDVTPHYANQATTERTNIKPRQPAS